jgi:hypothetical protein
MLTDVYNGTVDNGYSNPLAGKQAWCGDPQDWLDSVVDLSSYAGQNVQLRFRLGSDSSVGRSPGWIIDDVQINSCEPADFNEDLNYGEAAHIQPIGGFTNWLGSTIDTDPGPGSETNDGVTPMGQWLPGGPGMLSVTAQKTGWLAGWADWNNDQLYDASERVGEGTVLAGNNIISFMIPAGYVKGKTIT